MLTAKQIEAQIEANWRKTRQQIRAVDTVLKASFGNASIPGCATIEATHVDFPMPLATVWYRATYGHIEVLNSFVFEFVRRCGLRTFLHRQLIEAYPSALLITTGAGTPDGLRWLKATGFRWRETGWELRIRRRAK